MVERAPAEAPRSGPEDHATTSSSGVGSVSVEEATGEYEHAHEASGGAEPEESWSPEQLDQQPKGRGGPPHRGDLVPAPDEPSSTTAFLPGAAAQPVVSFHPVQEERSGDHLHMALTLSGLWQAPCRGQIFRGHADKIQLARPLHVL